MSTSVRFRRSPRVMTGTVAVLVAAALPVAVVACGSVSDEAPAEAPGEAPGEKDAGVIDPVGDDRAEAGDGAGRDGVPGVRADAGDDPDAPDEGGADDRSVADAAVVDDAGETPPIDASEDDAAVDASVDAAIDGSVDAAIDAAAPDAAAPDAAPPSNPGGCVSGVEGTHAARFRWAGSGAASTAYVQYEVNNLPDRSRWKAGAFRRGGVGYRPVYNDVPLGGGGLEMGGNVFIDVELSTAELARITRVTLSILGRSYNTSSSASFEWLTFDGAGQAPPNFVWNVVPYRWYAVDATTAFRPGNGNVLLRISPRGGSLVVSRVELCFETR